MLPTPSRFRIRVRGRLDPSWSDRLGGLAITVEEDGGETTTTLAGDLIDESAFQGVISALFDMQYVVISVDRVERNPSPPRG